MCLIGDGIRTLNIDSSMVEAFKYLAENNFTNSSGVVDHGALLEALFEQAGLLKIYNDLITNEQKIVSRSLANSSPNASPNTHSNSGQI